MRRFLSPNSQLRMRGYPKSFDQTNTLPNLELNKELTGISSSILPIRDSRGSTQSFQEYQERRNNLASTHTDEDLLLQRFLYLDIFRF